MYRVKYFLPQNHMREIIMDFNELESWLNQRWLRERIVSIEKID